jgi:hypothetical protein
MGSNYVGVDSFSANLTLQTDGDQPSAAIFRLPNERLLDNDVHLRNRVGALELNEDRGLYAEILEDFTHAIDNSGATVPHVLGDCGAWRYRDTGTASVSAATAAGAVGVLIMLPNSGSDEVYIGKELARFLVGRARMRALVRVNSVAAGAAAEVGFTSAADATPGDTGAAVTVSAYFNASVGTTWLLRTRSAGSESVVDSGVAVNTSALQRLEIDYDGTHWTLSVDGSGPVLSGVNAPSFAAAAFPVARATGQALHLDQLHFRSTLARW